MMISKNQGERNNNTSFGVFTMILSALMFVDAFTGGIVRQYFSVRMIEYAAFSFGAIVLFGDLVKESDPGGRLLGTCSEHGL